MSQDPLDVYPAADTAAMLTTLAIKPVCERYTEMLQARRLAHTDCARGVVFRLLHNFDLSLFSERTPRAAAAAARPRPARAQSVVVLVAR